MNTLTTKCLSPVIYEMLNKKLKKNNATDYFFIDEYNIQIYPYLFSLVQLFNFKWFSIKNRYESVVAVALNKAVNLYQIEVLTPLGIYCQNKY